MRSWSANKAVLLCFLSVVACLAAAPAQTVWFKYSGNPVLDVGPPDAWDSREVAEPRVLSLRDTLRMWYAGQSPRNFARIGYAWSTDGGLKWRKHPSNPVMIPTQPWELDWTFSPYVIHSGPMYNMWYTGADGFGQIGYAWSPDGITWQKSDRNPVVRSGPLPWDGTRIEWPSVLGPDSAGRFTMWYVGLNAGHTGAQIGYAEASDESTWTKSLNPVLTPATGGWAGPYLRGARVLYDGILYRMWYNGGPHLFTDHQIGYATSPDGKSWTHHPIPVLRTSRPDPWDAISVFTPEVHFDGRMYHMWYEGHDGDSRRIGYAVSPKGVRLTVSPMNDYVRPRADSLHIRVQVDDPADLTFSASIKKTLPHYMSPLDVVGPNLFSDVALIGLFDDGAHGDSLSGDGIFAGSWVPEDELVYYVDIGMETHQKGTRQFRKQNAAVFTSTGPITLEHVEFLSDSTANPGDTLLVKLTLRNHGTSGAGTAVRALLSTPQSSLLACSEVSPYYWDIPAGGESVTDGYYRIVVNPFVDQETDVPLSVTISTFDIPLWYDMFTLHVRLPWWKTRWAYGLYAALLGLMLFGVYRFNVRRIVARNELKMKAFSAEKLQELDGMKSRFFANISHEFRTPLTLIEGPAKAILESETDAGIKENAGMIVRQSARLLTLVNQLLDLSRIEAGTARLNTARLNFIEVVKGIAAAFESLAKRRGIGFRLESPEEIVPGWFDRDAVEKITANLLSNAFKFTESGGQVTLAIRRSERDGRPFVSISVSDTGIGISPDHIGRIFDRFYQADGVRSPDQGGTGIGLAHTKELVQLHKGDITVTSEPGRGSVFTVRLPLGEENYTMDRIVEAPARGELAGAVMISDESVRSETEGQETGAEAGSPLLLMVEDNADMRRYMRTQLEREYRIVEATNGEEGVEKAVEMIPDVVVSDVMMPGMDGFALCKQLKSDERTSHIPVILLTAKAETHHRIEGLETGADDYLTKPFEVRELLVRIRNLIEQRSRLRERFRREGTIKAGDVAVTPMDERFLHRALEVVETHIADTSFDTEMFAEAMYLSRMQLHRKIKALTGRSPWEFVRLTRLDRAAQLLRGHAGTVAEIAEQVGYREPTHFTEAFRKEFGVPPSEYARRHLSQGG